MENEFEVKKKVGKQMNNGKVSNNFFNYPDFLSA